MRKARPSSACTACLETPFYTPRERAALECAETLTLKRGEVWWTTEDEHVALVILGVDGDRLRGMRIVPGRAAGHRRVVAVGARFRRGGRPLTRRCHTSYPSATQQEHVLVAIQRCRRASLQSARR